MISLPGSLYFMWVLSVSARSACMRRGGDDHPDADVHATEPYWSVISSSWPVISKPSASSLTPSRTYASPLGATCSLRESLHQRANDGTKLM